MEHLDTIITIAILLIGQIYTWGRVAQRIDTLEDKQKENLRDAKETQLEIFNRLRALEGITPRIEETATRLEKVLNNGLSAHINNLDRRMAVLEKHCEDMHRVSPVPCSREEDHV